MQTDSEPTVEAQAYLQQMVSSIEVLNVRIARLAIALGVSLQNAADLADVMSRPDQRALPHQRRDPFQAHSSPGRRVARAREEIRGLLVLRYGIQRHYVNKVGVVVTREILMQAHDGLVRRGFRAGQDGIDLSLLRHDGMGHP